MTEHKKFFGTTSLGEKGQVVIPADVRKKMNLKKGERLLVFCLGKDMITLTKVGRLEKFADTLAKKLDVVRGMIKETK